MFSMDCSRCPDRPDVCGDCVVGILCGEEPQVDVLSPESCGYVLDPEVREAIDVLREVGVVSDVEILDVIAAA